MLRRVVIYAILAIGLYYGYNLLLRASATAPDMRQKATDYATQENKNEEDALGSAVKRRRAEEQAVEQSAGQQSGEP